MGSFQQPRVFNSLDLEIIDCVYEAAWAQVEAREAFRDRGNDSERQTALRKVVIGQTDTGRVDFDSLFEKVMANMPENWVVVVKPSIADGSSGSPEVGA